MSVGDVYQLAVDQVLHGVLLTNVFHFEQTIDGSGDDEADLFAAFEEDGLPNWKLAVSAQLMFTCLRARQVSGVGAFPESLLVLTGDVGALLEEALPANCVAVISWYSQTYSKSGRGRSFISGAPVPSEDENTWEEAQYDLFNTMANSLGTPFIDSVSGASFALAIWGGTPGAAKDVAKFETRPQVRKLRGRTTRACSTA
ncbi:unnamed protein product [marine sediment metagenome]|uniref:Uncharacterized protein n=1 Tax=marine sediment metagenome TaxID=412755 RepID=X0Z4Z5_9ZZZZ